MTMPVSSDHRRQIHWTAHDIPDQTGKTFLVTGANSGLGLGTSTELARRGAHVIMTARNPAKGEQALNEVKQAAPTSQVDLLALDLASFASIESFANEVQAKLDKLDGLINNAGVMMLKERQTTADGLEMQLGTNHFGHFALTARLWPLLKATPSSRIVTVSSIYGDVKKSQIYWDDVQLERGYSGTTAYAQSKFANQLFTLELAERMQKAALSQRSIAAHPGYTKTNLQRHMGLIGIIGNLLIAQRLEHGILPQLRAATDPSAQSGDYFGPHGIFKMQGFPVRAKFNERAHDQETRQRFWALSEELTGLKFEID